MAQIVKLTKKRVKFVRSNFFNVFTKAGLGIADLLCDAMVEFDGIDRQKAADKIWLRDIDGLISKVRSR